MKKSRKWPAVAVLALGLFLTGILQAHAVIFIDSGQALGNSYSWGVSLGDVDGDGNLDAFVANGNSQGNKVWLNDGSGAFTDSGQALGNSYSSGVSLGDIDGDGDLDAFVVDSTYEGNKVWLNDGSGVFTDSGQAVGNSRSYAVSLGDVDGDGNLDAFVANSGNQANNKVWLNNGSGVFTDSGQALGNSGSTGVSLGDVDGDGDLDAFVINWNQGNKVWLNDGSGVFTDSGQALGNSGSTGVSLGDVDGDGDLDAFVVNSGEANKVWLNNGSGVFTDSGQALGSANSREVSLGDVDGDGDLDAFVVNSGEANKVWLNDGSGVFTDSGQALGNSYSTGVSLVDVDGDGALDAFVANAGNQPNKVYLNTTEAASPSITPNPDDATPQIGDTINVVIDLGTVTGLYAVSFDLTYDPAVLDYTGAVEGNLLNSDGGATLFYAAPLDGNEANGVIVVGGSRSGDIGGVTGAGNVAALTFDVIGGEACADSLFAFANAVLEGPAQGSTITATWNGGSITLELSAPSNPAVADAGTHDQLNLSWDAVTNATDYEVFRSDDTGGPFTSLGTTGGSTSFNDNNCIIPTMSYYYKVKALADSGACISEFSVEASGYADGLIGDINLDGRVDGRDLSTFARAFGAAPTDTNWSCQADLDRTDLIDGSDLSFITANFGLTQ